MKRYWDYLRWENGETLVESLVSFLVIALTLTAFAGMLTAGSHMNAKAAEIDQLLGEELTESGSASAVISGSEGTVSVPVATMENELVEGYEA